MSVSRLDQFYRSLVLSKFFPKGWGSKEKLIKLLELRKVVSNRAKCQALIDDDYQININSMQEVGSCHLVNGSFTSPLAKIAPGLLPPQAETAHFQFVLPNNWTSPDRPLCIHMAGTGDHYFWRRRLLIAKPLLKQHGIASLIIENPFYGSRRPSQQSRSSLNHVYDLFLMGAGLILESVPIIRWCKTHNYGPFCFHGISMGGHMASLAATVQNFPVALVPCLSWTTASGVFTEGVMSDSINWESLDKLFSSDEFFKKELNKFINNDPHGLYRNEVNSSRHLKEERTKPKESKSLLNFKLPSKLSSNQGKLNDVNFTATESKPDASEKKPTDKESKRRETLHFMRCIMDEFTHLKNYDMPVDTELVIVVVADKDAYVPRQKIVGVDEIWPGCEIRYVNTGHVSAYIRYQGLFRMAIVDAFKKYNAKYYTDGTRRPKIPVTHALSQTPLEQTRPNKNVKGPEIDIPPSVDELSKHSSPNT